MKIPYAPYRFQIFLVCSSTVVSIYNHVLQQIIWKNQRHFGIHLLKKCCVLIIFFPFTYSVLIIYGSSFEYPQIHLLLFAYLLKADWSLCLSELLTSRINSLPTSAPNLQSTSSFFFTNYPSARVLFLPISEFNTFFLQIFSHQKPYFQFQKS